MTRVEKYADYRKQIAEMKDEDLPKADPNYVPKHALKHRQIKFCSINLEKNRLVGRFYQGFAYNVGFTVVERTEEKTLFRAAKDSGYESSFVIANELLKPNEWVNVEIREHSYTLTGGTHNEEM